MSWTKPETVEIKMDAEIGSYQADDERDRDEQPPIVDSDERS